MGAPPQLSMFRAPAKPRRGRPKKPGAGLSHARRAPVSARHPHHVTVRVRRGTWNLRSQRCFRLVAGALSAVQKRDGFRVTHFSVQGNHIHLLAEAGDRRTMSNGLRALFIRVAKQLNRLMGTRGPRFVDRFHEKAITEPTQARNTMRYVLRNHEEHMARLGRARDAAAVDVYCSLSHPTLVTKPQSWLLTKGHARAGPASA